MNSEMGEDDMSSLDALSPHSPHDEKRMSTLLGKMAHQVLMSADEADMCLSAAESCTGGFIASLLTGVEGLSHRFETGFVVYTDRAKHEALGIAGENKASRGCQ